MKIFFEKVIILQITVRRLKNKRFNQKVPRNVIYWTKLSLMFSNVSFEHRFSLLKVAQQSFYRLCKYNIISVFIWLLGNEIRVNTYID